MDWPNFISLAFPSSKLGGGPLMPCLLNKDLSLLGFATSALYKSCNNPMKPSTAREMHVFVSNCSSMDQVFSFSPFLYIPLYSVNLVFSCSPFLSFPIYYLNVILPKSGLVVEHKKWEIEGLFGLCFQTTIFSF